MEWVSECRVGCAGNRRSLDHHSDLAVLAVLGSVGGLGIDATALLITDSEIPLSGESPKTDTQDTLAAFDASHTKLP